MKGVLIMIEENNVMDGQVALNGVKEDDSKAVIPEKKKSTISLTAYQWVKMIDKHKVTFDNTLQRRFVWDFERNSLLIHTMLTPWMEIPKLYAKCGEEKQYDMIDGKQRSKAIYSFMKNEYALLNIPEVEDENGNLIDLNGKFFKDLSKDMQNQIEGYSLSLVYFENISDDEVADMMFRLNNGKPLSSIELTRMTAKSKDMIQSIAKHPIFKDALTEKALAKYTNEDIVIKAWAILNEEEPSLLTKDIRPLMKVVDITKEQADDIINAFTMIQNAHKVIITLGKENKEKKLYKKISKRILTRTHLVTIVPIALNCFKNGISENQFAEWLIHFYAGTKSASIDSSYNDNAGAGSAKAPAVKARLEAVRNDYKQFMVNSIDSKDNQFDEAAYHEFCKAHNGKVINTRDNEHPVGFEDFTEDERKQLYKFSNTNDINRFEGIIMKAYLRVSKEDDKESA